MEKVIQHLIQTLSRYEGCITLFDLSLEDRPLIYVNDYFLKLTGYTKEEVIGKNCRFLQGEETNKEVVHNMKNSILSGEGIYVDLVNYKKDGEKFFNRLLLIPIFEHYFLGIQHDVTHLEGNTEWNFYFHKSQVVLDRVLNPLMAALSFEELKSRSLSEEQRDKLDQRILTNLKSIDDFVISIKEFPKHRPKILILEDYEDVQLAYDGWLSSDYELIFCDDISEFKEENSKHDIDFYIFDLKMETGENSLDIIKEFKESDRTNFIIISAYVSSHKKDYPGLFEELTIFEKPVAWDSLLETLEKEVSSSKKKIIHYA